MIWKPKPEPDTPPLLNKRIYNTLSYIYVTYYDFY